MESKNERALDWDGLPELECGPTIPEQIRLWQKKEVDRILCNTAASPQETRQMLKEVDREVLKKQAAYRRLWTEWPQKVITVYTNPEHDPNLRSSVADKQPQEQE